MKTWLMTIALVSLLAVGVASAAIQTGAEFLTTVQQRVADGTMSAEQALLTKFYYALDRDRLPADLRPEGVAPLKCGTPLIQEYLRVRAELSPAAVAIIEGILHPADEPSRAVYNSPSGHFRITYSTTGTNAVPLTDLNANGVPDYVERVAEYFDYSWQREITELLFQAPPGAQYYITIQNLDGVYGYTQLSGGGGATAIWIENDFVGFPPNDDPDGDQLGAAKVTAAHEFKHASQYPTSFWSEGGWVEVDATWMEEIVYPATNDYHNYLPSGSPIAAPATPLDGGSTGTGSYEDCVWQHYMSEHWNNQFIVDFWNWRRNHTGESVLNSYNAMFVARGSSIALAWPLFATWNYATGARSEAGFGYHDAPDYPTGSPQRQFNSYPQSYTGTGVQHLAANFIRCLSVAEANKNLRITFNGNDAAPAMSLTAFVRPVADGYYFYEFDLDAANDGTFTIPLDLAGIYEIGLVVGNGAMSGASYGYTITVEKVDAQTTPVGEGVTRLLGIDGNFPNPFNPSTTISFAVAQAGPATLDLYDVRGQKVRTLINENLIAGTHQVRWDGADDQGRPMPSGTYMARLTSDGAFTTHKLVLAK